MLLFNFSWMINNNDRLAFGEDLTGEADNIFNPKEQYTVSKINIRGTL